jgi:hypothetical protein
MRRITWTGAVTTEAMLVESGGLIGDTVVGGSVGAMLDWKKVGREVTGGLFGETEMVIGGSVGTMLD